MDTSDGWFIAPPIFSFSSRRKRENGPCTVQKRKRSIVPAGGRGTGARLNDWRSQNDYPRAIGSHGGCSSLNGQAPLFAAAPRCSRKSCVYRALKNSAPKEEGLPLKNGRPSIHFRPPGQRQRKEELVHSSRDKPPLNLIARGKSFRLRRSFSRAPVASPRTSFSLLDRARPVFSFSSGRKRENGGCKGPAIFMAEIHPARRASSSLRTEANSAPPPRSGDTRWDAPHPPLRRAVPSSSARTCRLRPCGPLRRPRSRSGP